MYEQVKKVLDEEVRPELAKHYGDVELLSVEDGIITIRMMGSCSGCPSAKFTVEEIIETAIRKSGIEYEEVVVDHQVSEDLLDMARKILNKSDR